MYQTLFVVGLICAVIAGAFLAASAIMFFAFDILTVRKSMGVNGSLAQKQIEEIRKNSSDAISRKNKANIFEQLEKTAKPKKFNTHSLNVGPTTGFTVPPSDSEGTVVLNEAGTDEGTVVLAGGYDEGTVVLNENNPSLNADFTVEKDVVSVSSNDVM
jgi:hypothetical protein